MSKLWRRLLGALAVATALSIPFGCGGESESRLEAAKAEYEQVQQRIAVESRKGERGTREYKKVQAAASKVERAWAEARRSGDMVRYRELTPPAFAAKRHSRSVSIRTGRHHKTTWRLEDRQEALAKEIKGLEG
jgi:hypothetical protein